MGGQGAETAGGKRRLTRFTLAAILLATTLSIATLSGCGPRSATARPADRKLMVGPGLDRLHEMLYAGERTPEQRRKYWEEHRGKLVPATGTVVRTTETTVTLLCPLEKTHGTSLLVEGEPQPQLRTALPMFKPGQKLTIRGELTTWNPNAGTADSPEPAFILTQARIQIR